MQLTQSKSLSLPTTIDKKVSRRFSNCKQSQNIAIWVQSPQDTNIAHNDETFFQGNGKHVNSSYNNKKNGSFSRILSLTRKHDITSTQLSCNLKHGFEWEQKQEEEDFKVTLENSEAQNDIIQFNGQADKEAATKTKASIQIKSKSNSTPNCDHSFSLPSKVNLQIVGKNNGRSISRSNGSRKSVRKFLGKSKYAFVIYKVPSGKQRQTDDPFTFEYVIAI